MDFISQKRPEQAFLLLEAAAKTGNISEDTADIFNKLGDALKRKGDREKAISAFKNAVAIKPDFSEAHYNLGCLFNTEGKHDEAIVCYKKALQYNPEFAEANYNMGIAFQEKGEDDEAIACYKAALQISPDSALAWSSLGILWKGKRRFDEARDCFQKAVALDPALPEAHWNLATLLFAQGDYGAGWKEYEWRARMKGMEGLQGKYDQPLWQGEDIAGKTILIHAEQGMGDAIQFIRYARLVARRGARVIVEGQPELDRLLRQVEGIHDFIPRGNPLPLFDLQCPLLSLPLRFGTTVETIPGKEPYIPVDQGLSKKWRDRIGAGQGSVRAGLAWSGNPRHESDKMRSFPLAVFSCLADIRGVEFFSLQKGSAAAEAKNPPGGMKLYDFSEELDDFADTAALIANLDLIISVDTAVVHLAGALGKPVWTLLPFTPDWRWMLDRDDSPWYPSMRLFRQLSEGDWEGVLRRVRAELERFHN
jgi:Tfp pilus assembly protein PilF